MRFINLGTFIDVNGIPSETIVPARDVEGRNHSCLLSFLNADISDAGRECGRYIASVLSGDDHGVPNAAYDAFSSLHPWFSINAANTSSYLNRVFAHVARNGSRSMDGQRRIMRNLYAPRGLDSMCDADYWLYADEMIPLFDSSIGKDCDAGTASSAFLAGIQKRLFSAAVLLLDGSSPSLEGLSARNRIELYGDIFDCGRSGLISCAGVERSYGYSRSTAGLTLYASSDFSGDGDPLSRSSLLKALDEVSSDPSAIPFPIAEAAKVLGPANDAKPVVNEVLSPRSVEDLLLDEIFCLFHSGTMFRRAADGKFIIPGNTGAVAGSTAGADMEKIRAMYRNAYKSHHRRIAYGTMTKEMFSAWAAEAKEMMKKTAEGAVSVNEFSMWLRI